MKLVTYRYFFIIASYSIAVHISEQCMFFMFPSKFYKILKLVKISNLIMTKMQKRKRFIFLNHLTVFLKSQNIFEILQRIVKNNYINRILPN